MKSVKPGRGPSMMSAISSIFIGIFGVIWTVAAASMGAPGFFCLFGIFFVALAIGMAVYNFHNATAKRRFSLFDVTEDGEEPDPLDGMGGRGGDGAADAFCPACGAQTAADDRFCRKCGRELR